MAGIDSYVQALFRSNGIDDSTSFADYSQYDRTVATTGSGTIKHDNARTKFQATSIQCGGYWGKSAYISHVSELVNSGDFTVDFWFNHNYQDITFNVVRKFWVISVNTSGIFTFSDANASFSFSATTAVSADTWTHVALTRNGNVWTWWINGTAAGTVTQAVTLTTSTARFDIGKSNEGGSYADSYFIDEVRYSVGVARYSSNFTPPTEAYTSSDKTVVATGGAVAGGSAYVQATLPWVSAGGAVSGGAADVRVPQARLDATGGGVVGGASTIKIDQVHYFPDGGAIAGGSATVAGTQTYFVAGGAIGGGLADVTQFLKIQPINHHKLNEYTGTYPKTFVDSISGGRSLVYYGTLLEVGRFGGGATSPGVSNLWWDGGSVQAYAFESISLHFRRSAIGVTGGLLCHGQYNIQVYIGADDEIKLINQGSPISTGAYVNDANWHHLAIVKGSTSAKIIIYLDGTKYGTEFDQNWLDGIFAFSRYFGSHIESCGMDNIQVYDRKLSAEEVLFLATAQSEDYCFPMEFVGTGGAIVGGEAPWEFPLSFIGEGGAICGGTATYQLTGLAGPTQHWIFESINSGVISNQIPGGRDLYASGRTLTSGKFGSAVRGGEVWNLPLSISADVGLRSLSMWVQRIPEQIQCDILGFTDGTASLIVDFGYGTLHIGNGDGTFELAEPTLNTDFSWQHIVITTVDAASPSSVWVTINGVRASEPLAVGFFGAARFLCAWNWTTYGGYFCNIDNVQMYTRIISEQDAAYLYAADGDLVTAPRLGSVTPSLSGGAVAGGSADYAMRLTNFNFVATGGGIAGGQATQQFATFDCILAYPEVDMQVNVVNVARMDCTLLYPIVGMDTAGYMECVLEYPIVDIITQHTILAGMECFLAYPIVDIGAVTTVLYSMDCAIAYPVVDMLTRGSYYSMECILKQPTVNIQVDSGIVFSGNLGFASRQVGTYSNVPTITEEILCFSRQ